MLLYNQIYTNFEECDLGVITLKPPTKHNNSAADQHFNSEYLLGARVVDNRFYSAISAVSVLSSTALHINVTDTTGLRPSLTLVVIIG